MNIASLFSIEGPDLVVILLIVLLLYRAKNRPRIDGEIDRQPPVEKMRRESSRRLLTKVHCGFATAVGAPFPLFP